MLSSRANYNSCLLVIVKLLTFLSAIANFNCCCEKLVEKCRFNEKATMGIFESASISKIVYQVIVYMCINFGAFIKKCTIGLKY